MAMFAGFAAFCESWLKYCCVCCYNMGHGFGMAVRRSIGFPELAPHAMAQVTSQPILLHSDPGRQPVLAPTHSRILSHESYGSRWEASLGAGGRAGGPRWEHLEHRGL